MMIHSIEKQITGHTIQTFIQQINTSENILFLGDNSGEIVFDKLLIEHLPTDKITYVVKGDAIVNDALMNDALDIGLNELVHIIDNGTAIQGTELDYCSKSFIEIFNNADLIISKGQANYESLESIEHKNIFFLLKAKCQVIADSIGCHKNEFVLLHHQ